MKTLYKLDKGVSRMFLEAGHESASGPKHQIMFGAIIILRISNKIGKAQTIYKNNVAIIHVNAKTNVLIQITKVVEKFFFSFFGKIIPELYKFRNKDEWNGSSCLNCIGRITLIS